MKKSFTHIIPSYKQEWWWLFLVIILSSIVRLKINYDTEYIPGGNGAYYLVLVRNILEEGSSLYRDFPLIFWLEAAIAYIPLKLGLLNINQSVDFTVRTFDSIIPTLSLLPAYFISKSLLGENEKLLQRIVIASTSVLYVSFFMLVSDFQKNSLGLLWLFSLVYWILRVHKEKSIKNISLAGLFFVLTAITHYGCIAVAVTIVFIDLLVSHVLGVTWKKIFKAVSIISFVGIITAVIVNLINHWRLVSLLEAPLKIFEEPVIIYILKKEPVISPIDLITILLVNIIAASSLFLFVRKYKNIDEKLRPFILTMIIVSLFLASPFLGREAAQRLYFISYLTTLPLLAFLYKENASNLTRKSFITALSIILFLSVFFSLGRKNYSNMNRTVYVEMIKLENVIPENDRTFIVARHGMEFWSTWIFRNMAVRQEQLSASYWRWYNEVYFIVQKKNKSPFGPAGLFGEPFPEPSVPNKSELVFKSEYFEVYKSIQPPEDFSIFKKRD